MNFKEALKDNYFSSGLDTEDFIIAVTHLAKNRNIPEKDIIQALTATKKHYNEPYTKKEHIKALVKETCKSEAPDDESLKTLKLLLDDERADRILECLESYQPEPIISIPFHGDSEIYLDDQEKRVLLIKTINIKGKSITEERIVIDAYPEKISIYESPLPGETRQIKIQWISPTRQRFTEGPAPFEYHIETLKESGRIFYHNVCRDVLATIIGWTAYKGNAVIERGVDTPGFYYNENEGKIYSVKYDLKDVTTDDIVACADLLSSLSEYFDDPVKLATVLKWCIIAPFSYVRKQVGAPLFPYLYLYGASGSGKTSVARIGQYVYTYPTSENDVGGSSFDTVARVGHRISQSTFPIIINEPKACFDRPSTAEMIKVMVESTIGRGRHEGKVFKNIPSLSPVIFTSNHYLPPDDALLRRLEVINFVQSERKNDEDSKEFNEKFRINTPHKSPLMVLNNLGAFAAREFIEDVELCTDDWKAAANSIILRFYADAGLKPPEWLLEWSETETLNDVDDDIREQVRIFIVDQINNEVRKAKWVDSEEYNVQRDFSESIRISFSEKAENVLMNGLIPYMVLHDGYRGRRVVFTGGFKDAVNRATGLSLTLKGLSDILGEHWMYGSVKVSGRVMKCMHISFDEFVKFVDLSEIVLEKQEDF